MVNHGWRRKIILAVLAVAVLSLPIACNSADEEAGPAGTTPTPAAPPTSTPHPAVELTVGKTNYQVRERVRYTVTNGAESSVWYLTGGCDIPDIYRLEGEREIDLVMDILEEEIVPKELPADESLSCTWRQWAFWTPEIECPRCFRIGETPDQVPPGRYQFRFRYAFEEDHVYSQVVSTVIKSPVFTIE